MEEVSPIAGRVPALHRFAQMTAAAAFLLICAGGLVTSTGSALAVPDWPLSFGQFFPAMRGGVLFEHGHRMIAGVVGIMVIVLGFWIGSREPRGWVRRVAFAAMGAIVLQAILGGVTVLLKLPTAVSVSHACLAQAVLSLLVVLSVATSPDWVNNRAMENIVGGSRLRVNASVITTVLIYIQLILGAVVRHTGLAMIPHMIGAGVVTLAVFWSAVGLLRQPAWSALRPLAWASMALVLAQVSLGLTLYFVGRFISVTTIHVAVGALLLITMVVLSLRTAFPKSESGGQGAAPSTAILGAPGTASHPGADGTKDRR